MENKRLLLLCGWISTVGQTGLASPYCAPWEGTHVNMLQHPWEPRKGRLMGDFELRWNLYLSHSLAFVDCISCLPTICPLGCEFLEVKVYVFHFCILSIRQEMSKVDSISKIDVRCVHPSLSPKTPSWSSHHHLISKQNVKLPDQWPCLYPCLLQCVLAG